MTLDNFISDQKETDVGEVYSSLDPEDVEMSRIWWQSMAQHHPEMLAWRPSDMSEDQTRYFIQLLDNVIQDQVSGTAITDEEAEYAEQYRWELEEQL